jgi:hypothetical protein
MPSRLRRETRAASALGKTRAAPGGSSHRQERAGFQAVAGVKECLNMSESQPGESPADAAPQDAIAGREAQDHELADIETGGEPRPGLYPADDIENREGETRQPQNSEPHHQGVADPEPADTPTARDALGKKQPGFASAQQEQAEDSEEEPPLAK